MPTRAVSAQFEAKIRMLSQYSGLSSQVLKERLLAFKIDQAAQEEILDQQIFCYEAAEILHRRKRVKRASVIRASRGTSRRKAIRAGKFKSAILSKV